MRRPYETTMLVMLLAMLAAVVLVLFVSCWVAEFIGSGVIPP